MVFLKTIGSRKTLELEMCLENPEPQTHRNRNKHLDVDIANRIETALAVTTHGL